MTIPRDIASEAFNPEYRKGLREHLSSSYKKLCENVPGLTNELRRRAHRVIFNQLRTLYPSVRELGEYKYDHLTFDTESFGGK